MGSTMEARAPASNEVEVFPTISLLEKSLMAVEGLAALFIAGVGGSHAKNASPARGVHTHNASLVHAVGSLYLCRSS